MQVWFGKDVAEALGQTARLLALHLGKTNKNIHRPTARDKHVRGGSGPVIEGLTESDSAHALPMMK